MACVRSQITCSISCVKMVQIKDPCTKKLHGHECKPGHLFLSKQGMESTKCIYTRKHEVIPLFCLSPQSVSSLHNKLCQQRHSLIWYAMSCTYNYYCLFLHPLCSPTKAPISTQHRDRHVAMARQASNTLLRCVKVGPDFLCLLLFQTEHCPVTHSTARNTPAQACTFILPIPVL